MKNEEKYKTDKKRDNAFQGFCRAHKKCLGCPLKLTPNNCRYDWLELEASDESEAKN